MERSRDGRNTRFFKLRVELAERVSVAGIGYTIGTAVTFPRRTLWCLVVLSALAWMVILIYGRVTHFLSFPTATKVQIKTEQKLRFPAVTVCNQNILSATKVFNADKQRASPTLVEALNVYMNSILKVKGSNASVPMIAKIQEDLMLKYDVLLNKYDVSTLFEHLSMEKERFIHKCAWMGQEDVCSSDDFEKTSTDLGLCYTFNGNVTSSRLTSKTGPPGGLSLTLFIEHYDYFLHGASDVAGAMVHVHDQNESPALIAHTGVSLPVGFSTNIGLRTSKMTYLSQPHGICAEAVLPELPTDTPYSSVNCQLNCLTSYVKSKCGCLDSYMPRSNGSRFCTLLEKIGCLSHEIEEFSNLDILTSCACPLPCSSTLFSPYVSYASIADHFSRNFAILHRDSNTSSYRDKLNIQEWILLNALNTTYTDTIANISLTIVHLYDVRMQGLIETAENILAQINTSANVSHGSASNVIADVDDEIRWARDARMGHIQNLFKQDFECLEGMSCTNFSKNLDALIAYVVTTDSKSTKSLKFNNIKQAWSYLQMQFNTNSRLISRIEDETKQPTVLNKELLSSLIHMLNDYNSDIAKIMDDLTSIENMITVMATDIEPYSLWLYKEKDGDTEKYTPSYYKRNYLQVDVYFQDMTVQHVSQEESYSIIALFSDVGGSIGLCLGGSILTIVEIVDVIMTWWAGRKSEGEDTETKYEAPNETRAECKESIHM